jgi:hypothetical protein
MRHGDNLFNKGLFYYGTYKGFGAIFGLAWLFFVIIPIRLVRLLVRFSRR